MDYQLILDISMVVIFMGFFMMPVCVVINIFKKRYIIMDYKRYMLFMYDVRPDCTGGLSDCKYSSDTLKDVVDWKVSYDYPADCVYIFDRMTGSIVYGKM